MKVFILLLITGFISCKNKVASEQLPEFRYSSSLRKTKDSLFMQEAIMYSIKRNYPYFRDFEYFKIQLEKVTFWINEIYYSPDSLKMIAAVVVRLPNNADTHSMIKDSLFYYNALALIGYRKDINAPIITYRYPYYIANGWESYAYANNLLRNHLELNLKNTGEFIWSNVKNDWVVGGFDYNVTDSLVWTKSVLWQKGTILPGYYTFEVNRYVSPSESKHGDLRQDGINLEFRSAE